MVKLRDKLVQGFTVKGHAVSSADVQYVYKMLHKRLLFTCGWVERYLLIRGMLWGDSNRAADRLLQRWRLLGLIEFNRGYWHWTKTGKDLVL